MHNLKCKEKFCHHEACQTLEQVAPEVVQSVFLKVYKTKLDEALSNLL